MPLILKATALFLSGAILALGVWEGVILGFRCCNDSLSLYLPFVLIWLVVSIVIAWLWEKGKQAAAAAHDQGTSGQPTAPPAA